MSVLLKLVLISGLAFSVQIASAKTEKKVTTITCSQEKGTAVCGDAEGNTYIKTAGIDDYTDAQIDRYSKYGIAPGSDIDNCFENSRSQFEFNSCIIGFGFSYFLEIPRDL